MTGLALSALLSHWRRRPFQFLALILGLAQATALWSGVQAINAEARQSYDRAAEALGGDRPAIRNPGGPVPLDDYVALRRAGWPVTPVIQGWIEGTEGRVRLVGIEPLTAPGDMTGSGGAEVDIAAFLLAPGQLLAAPETARRLTGPGLPPVVTVAGIAPGTAIADIGAAGRLLGRDEIDRLTLTGPAPGPLADVAPGLVLESPDTGADLARLTDSFHLNLTAFGLLSFAVGLFIVNGTIGLAFEQRRGLFRTLRALGLPLRALALAVMAELLALALVAGGIGIVFGYLIASALVPDVAATLRGLYGVPVEGALTLRPEWWAAGLGIAVLGALVAGAGAVWKTLTLPVLAPARPRAWLRAMGAQHMRQLGAAGVLGLVALGAGTLGTGLLAGFALLGALLLAAALALPAALSGLVALAARAARSARAEWFWADTRQQLPGLSLALMALLLALATNIGVGTMVASFRLTFTGWLDQRLASELYVSAETPDDARRLADWLAPRTDAVLPIWSVEVPLGGAPGELYGVADHATYRDNWPLLAALPGVWDRVVAGDGVLINEQLARRLALSPGDPFPLPRIGPLPVAGIYSDYGNPQGQALVSIPRLTGAFPEVERLRFGLRLSPDDAPALARALVDDFGLPPDNVVRQSALKALSLEVFERTFTVTAALNVLTLAIAGFAILTALLTLAAMRLPQLAPAWALGMTRASLARLELFRAVALAALTALLALPLGLLLAWVLLAVINVEAFGWRLPMHLFPLDWLRLAALALLAAAAASLWPALRLRRLPPAALLRVFSHER